MPEVIHTDYAVTRLLVNLDNRAWALFAVFDSLTEAKMQFLDMQKEYGVEEVRLEERKITVLEGPVK